MTFNIKIGLLIGLTYWISPVLAPFPPCSPFTFLNKLIDFNSLTSDLSPFHPVQECPFEDPTDAPLEMQFFLANDPVWAFNTLLDEIIWFFEKGIPRLLRMTLGLEEFEFDLDILTGETESFQQFGRETRKTEFFFKDIPNEKK